MLSCSFILRYVTAPSSATGFTPTTASSADPLSITVTFLLRLGLGCRSYNGLVQTALHRVRSRTFIAHPPLLLYGIRKGYRASVVEGTSPFPQSLPEVRTELEWQFWLASFRSFIGSFSPVYPSSGRSKEFLWAPLLSPTYSLLSWAMAGLPPASS